MCPQPLPENAQASQTEQRLLNSALRLFAAKGYDATSIREIIEEAEVTRPVLYYYFKNKEDLFSRLIEKQFDDVVEDMDRIMVTTTSCRDRLRALTRYSFEGAEQAPEVVRFLLQFFFSPPVQNVKLDKNELSRRRLGRIAEIMRQGQESGELGPGDPETYALAFSGYMDLHIMAKSYYSEGGLTAELADALVDLFFKGARHGMTGSK